MRVFACPGVGVRAVGHRQPRSYGVRDGGCRYGSWWYPEVVVDGVTGYLVPYDPAKADDPDAVAAFEDGRGNQDQLDGQSGEGSGVRTGGTAALHRGVRLVQDRR